MKTVLTRLRCHHAPVAGHFGTMIGFELQRTESDIMVAVLLTCLGRGIIVLPIHDAVLCPASRAEEVETVMLGAFKTITRGAASVSHAPVARHRTVARRT